MADDQGKSEEDQFGFTPEGGALGYISMAQARQAARETPGEYGGQLSGVSMAFEIVESREDEDYYTITLSFRPQGDFSGRPGREQFFIEKERAIAHRQVLAHRTGRPLPHAAVVTG